MVFAIGAAAAALDAIQSLTSPQPASSQPASSQSIFGPALSDAEDGSEASPTASNAISGFSSAQISSDNISALLNSQNQAANDFTQALDGSGSSSDSDSSPSASASNAASSTYNAVNQLTQSTAVPLGFSPFSTSI